jgi:hypothetical protein
LLTTRTHPQGQAGTFNFALGELSLSNATELIGHHAGSTGLTELTQIGEPEAGVIYEVTGGNPLAIKLVVGLATRLPLDQILGDLIQAKTTEIEGMYRHIYWQAWRLLSEEAQALLEIMPLSAALGFTPDHMLAISALTAGQFWPAVVELVNCSLLETRGTVTERRYGIHRLTESFLQTEIIHWPQDPQ